MMAAPDSVEIPQPLRQFRADRARVEVYASKAALGRAAAARGAEIVREAVARRKRARIIVATGNSQLEVSSALVETPDLDWTRVEVFHMDEYLGLPADHPASFRRWVKERVVDVVRPGAAHYLEGDAPDWEAECRRYTGLLTAAPVDVCFLGIGENGHIAFNDPHEADFNDPHTVKRVALDERCRRQQVGEGHFSGLEAVPQFALTLTCPALMSAQHLVCCVPDLRKAEAVRCALEGPISAACPGSILRTHPQATIYLDPDSASMLASTASSTSRQ
jgi:glucosamine-6-phosphate deaminase